MKVFAKPVTAIIFGAFMFCAETCLHADTLLNVATSPLDLPYYDWTAAGVLAGEGVQSERTFEDGVPDAGGVEATWEPDGHGLRRAVPY